MGDLILGMVIGCMIGGIACTIAVTAAMVKRCEDQEERTQVYMRMAHRFREDYARIENKICVYIAGLKEISETIPPLSDCEYMDGQIKAASEILRMVHDESKIEATDGNSDCD